MNFQNLIQIHYWFSAQTPAFSKTSFIIVLAVLLVCFVAGLVMSLVLSKRTANKLSQKVFKKLSNWLLTYSIIALVFVFFRQVESVYLGMRALLGLWTLACLAWLFFVLKFIMYKVPEIKKAKEEQAMKEKYLPR